MVKFEKSIFTKSVDGQMIFPNLELIQHLDADIEIFVDATFEVTPFDSH